MPNELLDTFMTGLCVKIDEIRYTRRLGMPPQLSDSELVCLAMAHALLGFATEARRLRFAVIADKGVASKDFETDLAFRGAELLRPSFKGGRSAARASRY
ncbi:hypothetical protein AB4Z54_02305 [Streptomyces sp. MCAF7]